MDIRGCGCCVTSLNMAPLGGAMYAEASMGMESEACEFGVTAADGAAMERSCIGVVTDGSGI